MLHISSHRAAAEDLAHHPGLNNAHWHGEITGLDRAVGKRGKDLDAWMGSVVGSLNGGDY